MGADAMFIGVFVTLALFFAGVVYHAGQLSQRISNLEQWRGETRDDLRTIASTLAHLEQLIMHGER